MQTLLLSQMTFKQVWKRLAAQIIDLGLIFLMTLFLFMIIGVELSSITLFAWAYFWFFLIYCVVLDTYYQGTIGKLMLGLKVTSNSGSRLKLLTSFYRNFIKSSMIFFIGGQILFLVGRQGFHNKVTKCIVFEPSKEGVLKHKNPDKFELVRICGDGGN